MKYVRLYGFAHKRTQTQFEVTWAALKDALPVGKGSFVLGVAGERLLLDGVPIETGQAERGFAQLLTASGLASIQFCSDVAPEEFEKLVRAFAFNGAKAQDLADQIKSFDWRLRKAQKKGKTTATELAEIRGKARTLIGLCCWTSPIWSRRSRPTRSIRLRILR